ncbi:MAG: LLM class F420-dependent oxidoreductase [Chloroflexi bacterium]|nr:LLM class F420-dependent oxidoreductase [Chloroflexota bacterium]
MRLGLFIGAVPTGLTLTEQVKQIIEAEKSGLDSFWLAQTGESDVLTTIALAGGETDRIELGTGVIPTYTRHPNVLAQQAVTVNSAVGGRLLLGIGPSHKPNTEGLGLRYERPAQHIREYVQILRSLTVEGEVDFRGEYYTGLTTRFNLEGSTPFPILVSALAPRMLQIAGELADGTVTWMAGVTALRNYLIPEIRRAASEVGRSDPRVVVGVPVAVVDDQEEGRSVASEVFSVYGKLDNYRRILDRGEVEGPASVAITGDENSVASQIEEYASIGVTDLVAMPYPVGANKETSLSRTRDLLVNIASA